MFDISYDKSPNNIIHKWENYMLGNFWISMGRHTVDRDGD